MLPFRMRSRRLWIAMSALLCVVSFVAAFAADPPQNSTPAAPPESFTAEQQSHWAYQTPKRPAIPQVKDVTWVQNPIDRFILEGLESVEFKHAAEADRVALIRRVTFDLTGLPPTPDEVSAFLNDSRVDAYGRVVDRLLESPAYGPRWAQHWLDLAHYADSNGFELDAERPDAWRYRDWVVKALNDDMPYDRFVTLQLAGDEASPNDHDALVATGFGRCGPRDTVGGNIDLAVKRQTELTEITGTVGSVFLGLTLGCARCHDHKFDALPTTDYYRLQSFFAAAEFDEVPTATERERKAYEAAKAEVAKKAAPFRARMGELEAPYRKAILDEKKAMLTPTERAVMDLPAKNLTPAQKRLAEGFATTLKVSWEEVAEAVAKNPAHHAERETLKRAIHELDLTLPHQPSHAQALIDKTAKAPETFVARRGDPKLRGTRVEPRPPGIVLAKQPANAFEPDCIRPTASTTGRRLALADWLTRGDNPLTGRVIVNRLWQHHFGRGIVSTPSDFGVRGERPSHPQLLDWLATELVAQGWRLKPIHRLMVTSATYRQASTISPPELSKAQTADDPDNTLFWRMNRRRVEAESLRDAMLVVTGEFNPRAGGPGVRVPIEKEVEDLIFTEAEVVDLWEESPDVREHLRRSIFLFRKRNVRYPMFDAFDAPDTQTPCPQRGVSTHSLQALVMLNSEFAQSRARALASRVRSEADDDPSRVDRAYRLVLARGPSPRESEQALRFLSAGNGTPDVWVDFALAMLNRNEFVYVP